MLSRWLGLKYGREIRNSRNCGRNQYNFSREYEMLTNEELNAAMHKLLQCVSWASLDIDDKTLYEMQSCVTDEFEKLKLKNLNNKE